MYSEPCARLTMFMMPSTSVSPAAIRNSMTPYCRPFSSCSKTSAPVMNEKGRSRALFPGAPPCSPLHLAVLEIGVLMLLERLLHDLHRRAVLVVGLHRLEQVEVLDRVLVDVELELAADRVVVRLAHRHHQGLAVLQVALGGAHRRVDQHDAVVALRAVVGGRVAELLLEVGDIALARRDVEVRAPEARLVLADRCFLQRR